MLYPGTYEHDLVKSLRDVLAHEPLYEDGEAAAALAHGPELWNAQQRELARANALTSAIKSLIRLEGTRLERQLEEAENRNQQLRNEVMGLQSLVSVLQSQYQSLVGENERFMKACVCVKLNQEPNNPESVFK